MPSLDEIVDNFKDTTSDEELRRIINLCVTTLCERESETLSMKKIAEEMIR